LRLPPRAYVYVKHRRIDLIDGAWGLNGEAGGAERCSVSQADAGGAGATLQDFGERTGVYSVIHELP
jgi:hypothetical protein